ncbi:MAG: helix-turn-helix transcriptional regulator [Clostridia bacterium]
MDNRFADNLKVLCERHTQKKIANLTGFSQSSINNYINRLSEPSVQFLLAINKAFGYSLDEFMFDSIADNQAGYDCDKFKGSYMLYYYDNTGYKGEVHENLRKTLVYGVMTVTDIKDDGGLKVYASTFKSRRDAENFFGRIEGVDNTSEQIALHEEHDCYVGQIHANEHNMFVFITNDTYMDECSMIFNNPPSQHTYTGGLGTINSVSRGREFNPCVQYILFSKKIIHKPDGELYNMLQLELSDVNFDKPVDDIVDMLKRLYVYDNELSKTLSEDQKKSIIANNLKYNFGQIIDNNMFRFAKISNREDDGIYQLLREE